MELFDDPKLRDQAIATTCSNLIEAGGILTNQEYSDMMAELLGYSDTRLAIALLQSHQLKEEYLETKFGLN